MQMIILPDKSMQSIWAVVINDQYYYDEEGYLRSNKQGRKEMSDVRKLFHYLNQVKESLALVILENEEVYGRLLNLLQGKIK